MPIPTTRLYPSDILLPGGLFGTSSDFIVNVSLKAQTDITVPSFDLNLGDWFITYSGNDTVTYETVIVNSGSGAVRIEYVDGTVPTIFYSQYLSVTPEVTLYWEFYTRGDGSVAGNYSFTGFTTGEITIVDWTSTGVSGVTYTKVSGSFVIPTGCTYVRLYLRSSLTPGVVYFDDVAMGMGTVPGSGSGEYTPANSQLYQIKKSGQGQSFNLDVAPYTIILEEDSTYLLEEDGTYLLEEDSLG